MKKCQQIKNIGPSRVLNLQSWQKIVMKLSAFILHVNKDREIKLSLTYNIKYLNGNSNLKSVIMHPWFHYLWLLF
jgi:hypothetical protein